MLFYTFILLLLCRVSAHDEIIANTIIKTMGKNAKKHQSYFTSRRTHALPLDATCEKCFNVLEKVLSFEEKSALAKYLGPKRFGSILKRIRDILHKEAKREQGLQRSKPYPDMTETWKTYFSENEATRYASGIINDMCATKHVKKAHTKSRLLCFMDSKASGGLQVSCAKCFRVVEKIVASEVNREG